MRLMVRTIACIFCSCLWAGCSYFGYYKYEKAVRLPLNDAKEVVFPNSYESGLHMDGRMTRALFVAMNDFLPPGGKFQSPDQRVAWCLSRWENYDTSVQRVSDDLFFIRFAPILSRCGIDAIVLDVGAEYAIDGHGRILDVH
jgi:hypothetical protein